MCKTFVEFFFCFCWYLYIHIQTNIYFVLFFTLLFLSCLLFSSFVIQMNSIFSSLVFSLCSFNKLNCRKMIFVFLLLLNRKQILVLGKNRKNYFPNNCFNREYKKHQNVKTSGAILTAILSTT